MTGETRPGLKAYLRDLHAHVHTGAYRARPSRRVFIPKSDGRLRPLGVAALEDKIIQRALVEVLNAIYETDFLGFSYGFRPGRSPHHALDALAAGIVGKNVNWVLDADVSDYFSSLDHQWLMKFLEHRTADQRVLRLIQKWLAAGVIQNGSWTAAEGWQFRLPACRPVMCIVIHVNATSLEQPIEGLWATPGSPLPFDTSVSIRSFLLEREEGNVIVYNAPGLGSAAEEIRGPWNGEQATRQPWARGDVRSPPDRGAGLRSRARSRGVGWGDVGRGDVQRTRDDRR